MNKVKLLPENLINKIAAGEVIERPASILKELLENSLDAGADQIEVSVLSGGKKLLMVRDNGHGMTEEDLFMCLERHATSKIGPESDLMNIATLGFRGEALPSVSAVAKLKITSSIENGEGRLIHIEGGRLLGMTPMAANRGTSVEVTDLFYNVPARKKFLKTDATESSHLVDIAQRYALSREGLRLVYREGTREIFSVDSKNDFTTKILKIMGRDTASSLMNFELNENDLSIKGWLSNPNCAGRSAAGLFLYVLGRPVKDRLLTRAVVQGYGRLLPDGRWPTGVIFLDLDPARVDVNVHPAKAEVRFREPGLIFESLKAVVSRTVGSSPLVNYVFEASNKTSEKSSWPTFKTYDKSLLNDTTQNLPWMDSNSFQKADGGSNLKTQNTGNHFEAMPSKYDSNQNKIIAENGFLTQQQKVFAENNLLSAQLNNIADNINFKKQESLNLTDAENKLNYDKENFQLGNQVIGDNHEKLLPLDIYPLAQLQYIYILAQSSSGLYIIDQHAAHERIMFNQLKQNVKKRGLDSQALLFADTFELPAQQVKALEILIPFLKHLGFDISHFGGNSFVLRAVPSILKTKEPWPVILELLGSAHNRLKELEGGGIENLADELLDSWLYSLACRAALKAGKKMSHEEMVALLDNLAKAQYGGFCPHGRPSVISISRLELDKKFGRI